MTTEIAVLNRLGIALAADSAVTISGAGTTKVFNSADKLFELSCLYPVAVMLNGNMDCFGVPWDIIIKDFRDERGSIKNKPILEWAKEFIDFVEKRNDLSSSRRYVELIASNELKSLSERVFSFFTSKYNSKKSFDLMIGEASEQAIIDRLAELGDMQVSENLKDITDEEILSENKSIIDEVLETQTTFLLNNNVSKDKFYSLICAALRAIIPNDLSTGLIIAGYGNSDSYPSVATIDVDGLVNGHLKYSSVVDKAKINRPELGYAVSFAQTDVIERLLSGVDPRFIKKTSGFLANSASTLAPLIVDSYMPNGGKMKKKKEIEKIQQFLNTIEETYSSSTASEFKDEFREEFERMIALMPKLELIELAEALISITAIERKATSDEGTVGGPIDVAFITKHEGFVWIKRKHYFQANLNPRYFWRKYRRTDIEGVMS